MLGRDHGWLEREWDTRSLVPQRSIFASDLMLDVLHDGHAIYGLASV
jgi:hypothetical protein